MVYIYVYAITYIASGETERGSLSLSFSREREDERARETETRRRATATRRHGVARGVADTPHARSRRRTRPHQSPPRTRGRRRAGAAAARRRPARYNLRCELAPNFYHPRYPLLYLPLTPATNESNDLVTTNDRPHAGEMRITRGGRFGVLVRGRRQPDGSKGQFTGGFSSRKGSGHCPH